MAEQFLHGIETIEIDDGIRPIRTVKSSVIGLIGTAPDADASVFPLNEPVAIVGNPRIAALLGEDGTLKDNIDRIFDQAGATVVVVRVEEGATTGETRGNIAGDAVSQTGVWAFLQSRSKIGLTPRVLCAPGFTDYRVNDGVLDVTMTEVGSGYLTAPVVTFNDGTGGSTIKPSFTAILGTGANAGTVVEIRIDNPGEGVPNDSTITIAAPPAGTTATATLSFGIARNPIVSEMMGIADRLRAVIIADAPATTDAAAIQWREDYGSKRVYVVEPKVLVYDGVTNSHVAYPASGCVAGLISRVDKDKGFWWSPSNLSLIHI
jgi:phage tail sheath protein FI